MENDFLLFLMKRTHQEKKFMFQCSFSCVIWHVLYNFFCLLFKFSWYDVALLVFFMWKWKYVVLCSWNGMMRHALSLEFYFPEQLQWKENWKCAVDQKTWIQWFLLTHRAHWNTHDDYEWRKTGISTAKWDDEK